jgi:hypothetical protein
MHRFARLSYWLSMVLLLAGAWILIDPYARTTGQTVQVYIAAGAFELYLWILLIIGRWQVRRNLLYDARRSGLFAVVLSVLLFIVLIELDLVSPDASLWITALAVIGTIARLMVAPRWLGFTMPRPMQLACVGWIAALALPPLLLRGYTIGSADQASAVYVCYLLIALLAAGHVGLVAWQKRAGFVDGAGPLDRWWTPWLLLGIVATLAVAHLHAVTWAVDCDAPRWFHSPLVLAIASVGFILAIASRQQVSAGGALLGLAVIYTLVGYAEGDAIGLPDAWDHLLLVWLTHPLGASGALFVLSFGVGAALIRQWALIGLAVGPPAAWLTVESADAVYKWRHGRGVVILLGAFALLAIGVALQWLAMKRPPRDPKPDYGSGTLISPPVPPPQRSSEDASDESDGRPPPLPLS